MNIEHYENLVGVLTQDLCMRIFEAGDKLMGILETYGVDVEYGDGDGELCPGNSYRVYRVEGYIEEYGDEADDTAPVEYDQDVTYWVNLETGMAEDHWHGPTITTWSIPPWLLSLIRQHNLFHIRTYYAANAVIDNLGKDETAVKYLDSANQEWGYEVFREGRPVRSLPEGMDRL
jgi:hypothetical protein